MSDNVKLGTPRPQRLLGEGLIYAARRHPGKPAVVVEGVSYTYAQLLDEALRLASALQERGITRGDRIAIYMDNSWPCIVSIYAVLLAGGVFLLINPQTKSDKLAYILDDSDSRILLSEDFLSRHFAAVTDGNSGLERVICAGDCSAISADIPLESLDEVVAGSLPLKTPLPVIPNDLAALIYTSGSTGFPKGVMQTHQAMVFAAWSLIEYLRLGENDRIIVALPLAFDYGLYQLLMTIKLGATLVVEKSFTYPAQVFKHIEDHAVTVFPGVPTMYAMIISMHRKKPLCFPRVTRITNTAAALPARYVSVLHEIFPNALIYKMYGLTECKRVSYLEPELVDEKPASVGKAIPGTEVYLLSPDGQSVAAGEPGILYVRGPHIMAGYWKKPELSNEILHPGRLPGERVLCTQDWFRMDAEGFLYFMGRSDDIIKTRGEKVSPLEVENAIHAIKGVKEVAVVGVPDEVFGQAIRAYIECEPGVELTDKKVKHDCLSRLENFMVPSDVIFLDDIPKTPNGKIDRKYLADNAGLYAALS